MSDSELAAPPCYSPALRVLRRAGWEIAEFTIDLLAVEEIRIRVKRNDGLEVVAALNAGRGRIEFFQCSCDIEVGHGQWRQASIGPRARREFVGRVSNVGRTPRELLSRLGRELAANSPRLLANDASAALRLIARTNWTATENTALTQTFIN